MTTAPRVIRTLIWDFNGTLLPDVALCLGVLNGMLRARGLAEVSRARYLEIFRFPVRDYYALAGFDFAAEPFEALADEFMAGYNARVHRVRLRAGAREVLAGLRDAGVRQVLLSATERGQLREQARALGIDGYMEELLGTGDILAHGKLHVAREWFARGGCVPAETLLVGDTCHDFEVAQALGAHCALVSGGHYAARRLRETGAPVCRTLRQAADYARRASGTL